MERVAKSVNDRRLWLSSVVVFLFVQLEAAKDNRRLFHEGRSAFFDEGLGSIIITLSQSNRPLSFDHLSFFGNMFHAMWRSH